MDVLKRDESGFTLVEMLIVIIIISTLLLIAVPNMSKSNEVVSDKSCEVTRKLVQSQYEAYKIANPELTDDFTLDKLVPDYIDKAECPGGEKLILANDEVQIDQTGTDGTTQE